MRKDLISSFVLALTFISAADAASYKCKDANGNWTEQACPDYQQRQQQAAQKASEENALRKWQPRIGMTEDEITQVIQSKECYMSRGSKWCGHHEVNTTRTAKGTREQWVWTDVTGMPIWYMYFTNGVLTFIQE
jgi:hypothetical protein